VIGAKQKNVTYFARLARKWQPFANYDLTVIQFQLRMKNWAADGDLASYADDIRFWRIHEVNSAQTACVGTEPVQLSVPKSMQAASSKFGRVAAKLESSSN